MYFPIIFAICFLAVIIITCVVLYSDDKIKELKKENRVLKNANINYITLMAAQREEHELEIKAMQKKLLQKSRLPKDIPIPKGTIEAVKYAMLHNHPDNGGSSEKFILYKSCYDKLTGRK